MSDLLRDLAEKEAAATPGPWASGGDQVYAGSGDTYSLVVSRMAGDWPDADAALIVAARNALPALLRVAEAAGDVLTTLRRVVDDAESQHPGGWGPDVTTVADLRRCIKAIAAAYESTEAEEKP